MFRKLYDWTMSLAGSRKAGTWLAAVSFAESSFFPIPPDVMLVPMVLARRDKAFTYALICTVSSVLGGILGYAIGLFLFDSVGAWLIRVYGYGQSFDDFRAAYAEYGAWIILIKGLTPIPFKLVTIASGFAAYDFPLFVALCVVTRGARFFLVAFVVKTFGPAMLEIIEKRLALWTFILVAVLVGAIVAVRFI